MPLMIAHTLPSSLRACVLLSEVRAEINELISQLEAKNPTPNPTEVRAAAADATGPAWKQGGWGDA